MPPTPITQAEATQPRSFIPEHSVVEALFDLPLLRDLPFRSLLITGCRLLILLAIFLIARWALRAVIRRMGERLARQEVLSHPSQANRIRTLTTLGESTAFYILLFFFAVGALSLLGVNVMGLLGTAGVAGLAIGFGAQKLVKDVISGFFILMENQYAVGEYVTAGGTAIAGGGVTGTIEELGMRSTRLRDNEGKLYIVSNGDISQVCNYSRGPVMNSLEVSLASSVDIAHATEVLNEALATASESLNLAEPAKVLGVSSADANKITLNISFRVTLGGSSASVSETALHLREAVRNALVAAEIPLA